MDAPNETAGRPSLAIRVSRILRQYFFSGLATLFPLAVTIYVTVMIFNSADRMLRRVLGLELPGLGLIVTLLIILLVGMFSVHVFGRFLLRTLEFWLNRLPLVKRIYPTVKQFTDFIFEPDRQRAAFRRVVLVPYPRPGSYTIAFVTNESVTTATGTSRTLVTLLVPQPPSPFTGPIIIVPKEDLVPLTMSVEEAIKLVVSAGVVSAPLAAEGWEDKQRKVSHG